MKRVSPILRTPCLERRGNRKRHRRLQESGGKRQAGGIDGIEIHGANGYLIDQFLKDGTNKRTDRYSQSIENRARFALEVTNAILTVWDRSRVGIRLSPVSPANDAVDSNPEAIFFYLIEQLSARKLAYIHVIEGATGGPRDNVSFDFLALRKAFAGAYILRGNPDLVERLRKNAPLNVPKKDSFYGGGSEGYTDYPTLGEGGRTG